MESLNYLLSILWMQNFKFFTNPSMIRKIDLLLFIILFLENGFLFASFLPGDSLLLLVGCLCAKGKIAFLKIVIILTIAASLGYWISYLQGRWLSHRKFINHWISYFPTYYYQRAYDLFCKYCLLALLVGRFISFVRTILPIIVGLSRINNIFFQFFNWISSLVWVLTIITIGYFLGRTSIFSEHEDQLMSCLVLLPIVVLIFSIIGLFFAIWKKERLQQK